MYLVQQPDCHRPIVITWSEGTLAIANSVARPILKEWFLKYLLERQAYDIALFKIAPNWYLVTGNLLPWIDNLKLMIVTWNWWS